jgi:hypothetical protein
VVDAEDDRIASGFGIWEQGVPSLRWSSTPSTRRSEIDEVHATVTLFTRYALASD